jgi:hypothetical protein
MRVTKSVFLLTISPDGAAFFLFAFFLFAAVFGETRELGGGDGVDFTDALSEALVDEYHAVRVHAVDEEVLPVPLVEEEYEGRPVLLVVHSHFVIWRGKWYCR